MGSSYQTVLVAGERAQVRRGLWWGLRPAVVLPVGERRWAVVPRGRHGYAETAGLARRLSLGAGVWTARFEVFDSDFLTAEIYSGGQARHEYHSDQGYVIEDFDEDGEELLVDRLGRVHRDFGDVVHGPYGADPSAFAPLGLGEIDLAALGAVLSGEARAEDRHHELLHLLNLTPGPLQMTYAEALRA
ncbi:hypothetical protein [Actinoplanes sp. NPDC026670]|uniref:hypothetical protein n=1 Tax=Actinoplanes sp. NPDC026670 TaxID=3154700 RepID=UPI0034035052